jgi:soluble lytic murein transglycosylase-like protein
VSAKEQSYVINWIAKRYRIAQSASKMLVEAAYSSAQEVKLDPLLVLSVMAIESRFNPFAESSVGAQGLMQVMAKVHQTKFLDHGGTKSVLNPVANIQVGAKILKDLIRRSGSVESGLKLYVGAGNLESDGGYAAKVLAEYSRLQAVANGKRVPTYTPQAPAPEADGLREAKALEDSAPVRMHVDEPA